MTDDGENEHHRRGKPPRVIVLNGASSSGKTTLARALQARLPQPWLVFSVDDLVDALPPALWDGDGIAIAGDGGVSVGDAFRAQEAAWYAGLAAMVHAGARLVVDEVFLGGRASQRRLADALRGLPVLWVGVRCDAATAEAREHARSDRTPGMAASQLAVVHQGVVYDVEVDTTTADPAACAKLIAEHLPTTA